MNSSIKIENKKYRNVGVLFEMLVRQITADTLVGVQDSAAVKIMKKYFNASTELGKELQLYRAFFENTTRLTEAKAIHFIDLIVQQRKTLNEQKLAREKYNLIREIKEKYSLKDFLSCKIPNYTIHASIYKTFLSEVVRDNAVTIMNIGDVTSARFTLMEHLIGSTARKVIPSESNLINEYRAQSDDIRLLAYKFIVDKFNEKYANLNEKQKDLLREYINNSATTNSLLTYIRKEIPVLQDELHTAAKKTFDRVTSIKLREVASQLEYIGKRRTMQDNEVTALMITYELLKEVNS